MPTWWSTAEAQLKLDMAAAVKAGPSLNMTPVLTAIGELTKVIISNQMSVMAAVKAIPTTGGSTDPAVLSTLKTIGLQLDAVAATLQTIEAAQPKPPGPAVGLHVQILEAEMSTTTLSVDVANQEVSANYVDDKGDEGATVPDGASVAFSSSDESVVSVGAATQSSGGATAPLTFNKAGTATLSATANDAGGAPMAGLTPGTADLELTPGAAASLAVSVGGAPPVDVPPPPAPA